MTLPKIFSLASKSFSNFATMSFEESANSSLSRSEQQQQHLQHQSAQNSQQQLLNVISDLHSTTMSTLPSISHVTNTSTINNTIFGGNAVTSPNTNMVLSPLQIHSENQETQLFVECVMPSIYLTKDFITWKEDQLHTRGFTHIIIIDKHIQELYYPNQQPDIFKLCSLQSEKNKNIRLHHHHLPDVVGRGDNNSSSSLNAFDYDCPPTSATKVLSFGKEFDVIDLNFGEKSYLTTVLPNCYKAVKFINKALQAGGTILVIDCNGGEQKCITIVVAYLMYKHNISFCNAFARLKEFYKKADLDRFYKSQLYEYEPILQVQRAQSRGHSCSRELHAAILKRKKSHDDTTACNTGSITSTSPSSTCFAYTTNTVSINTSASTTTTELLNNCNPLNRFDSTQLERKEMKITPNPQNRNTNTYTRFMSGGTSSSATTTGGWYNWDDCAME